MEPPVIVAVITAAGVVLAGIFAYLGVRYTQRQTARAAEATARLERTKVDASAYERARETYEKHVESLSKRVDSLEAETERGRITIRELRERIDELETGRDRDRDRIRDLTSWARDVLRILAEHGIAYPTPPHGLDT